MVRISVTQEPYGIYLHPRLDDSNNVKGHMTGTFHHLQVQTLTMCPHGGCKPLRAPIISVARNTDTGKETHSPSEQTEPRGNKASSGSRASPLPLLALGQLFRHRPGQRALLNFTFICPVTTFYLLGTLSKSSNYLAPSLNNSSKNIHCAHCC